MKARLLILTLSFIIGFTIKGLDADWVKAHYTKTENMIEMRDGVKLYTSVYAPTDSLEHPILMYRSTYGSHPYGEELSGRLWSDLAPYAERGYIIVMQDVRGQYMSEGVFENVRPVHIYNEKGANDVTDVYDTAEWLVNNTRSNGNIGVDGCSYLGFTAFVSALSGHPAIKAVCPQAPVTDWFLGDDFHHNGIFMPNHSLGFMAGFGRVRKAPTTKGAPGANFYNDDEYSFYLRNRALPELSAFLGDSIPFWNDMMEHAVYDKFWSDRNPTLHFDSIAPAVMVVGGWFDAEDLYGALANYRAIEKGSPETDLYLLMGPWSHGSWTNNKGDALGNLRFGSNTAEVFASKQLEFFEHYLRGIGEKPKDKITVFSTGDNKWHTYRQWPEGNDIDKIYLNDGGKVSFTKPECRKSFSSYISDPDKPVPHTARTAHSTGGEYMYEDQRFAATRPDVLTFISEPLDSPVSIAGPVVADIWMSSSTSDADLVVKVIDVYPEFFRYPKDINPSGYTMGGFQHLVRGDIMQASFRDSFSEPKALKKDTPTLVSMTIPDVCHTFERGHRIMIQVQSSWFPLFRMSPQQFINPYKASDSDFREAEIKIYHESSHPSSISFSTTD